MGGATTIERRLRRALIGVSMLCAVLLLLLVGVVVTWRLDLLGPEGDPFTRGPHLTEVTRTTATCAGASPARTTGWSCGRWAPTAAR